MHVKIIPHLIVMFLYLGLTGPATATNLRILWEVQPDEASAPTLQWLEERGWLWGVEVRDFTPVEVIEALKERGWQAVMHLHAHPETAHED
ncbi:hypothetical protein [Roseovarius pacificus]|uniref:hypothetical protein n=1 Tax=Roseovarius pacificus TaxID=337701 RepID=UPI002A18C7FE|nr:hypothetical protein [Roseovarius pacificus]